MALVYLSAAWLAGVYLGLNVTTAARPAPLVALTALLLALIWRRQPRLRWLLLGTAVAAVAVWRAVAAVAPIPADDVSHSNGREVTLHGLVAAEPEVGANAQEFLLRVTQALADEEATPRSGLVAVTTLTQPRLRYGDEVALCGRLEAPADFDTFAYRDYLARQGVRSLMRFPELEVLAEARGEPAWEALYAVRRGLRDSLARLLPQPQGALAAGLLLGDRAGIPRDLADAFRLTGTSHILAVSGWQVAVVAGLLGGIGGTLLRRRRTLSLLLAAAGVVAYVLLVGAVPSVLRAGLMGLLALVALGLGRPRDGQTGLAFACLVMTAVDPQVIMDVGFQLSALATLGLLVLAPRLLSWLKWLPAWMGAVLATTLAAQLTVLPILALNFHQLSPLSPLVNLLAVPTVPGAMEWSAVAALLGLVWWPLGTVAGWLAWLYLSALIWVVEAGARLPLATINLDRLHPAFAWAYYGLLLLILDGGRHTAPVCTALHRRLPARVPRPLLVALGSAAALALAALWLHSDGALHLTVLDVGQGDALLIRTPAGHHLLIDGGPSGTAVANALGRRLPFWDKSLDLVVLTHAHDDHLVGLLDVVQTHRVRQVLQGPAPPNPSPVYRRWAELLQSLAVPAVEARSGQVVALGDDARLEVLHVGEARDGSEDALNDTSVVLRLISGTTTVYLLGDAGPAAQRWLLAQGRLTAGSVLKVPHHGAEGSLDEGFVRALAPQAALLSVGQSNLFGHPSLNTLALLRPAEIYRTDLDGTIEVTITGDGYRVEKSR